MERGNGIRRLPDGEWEIMQLVWQFNAPVSRMDLENAAGARHLAPTTILTLLTRLVDKGFLRAEKAGRSNVYTPLITQREYLAAQSQSFLTKLCGGSVSVFAAALTESGISREELEELRRLLETESL